MPYKEDLPLQCPPENAVEDGIEEAFRMVYSNPPAEADFLSKNALGHVMPPNCDPCGFASCSLQGKREQAVRLAELPVLRDRGAMVAKVTIPAGSGRWTKNKKKHIHFWMYEDCDPLAMFVEMVLAQWLIGEDDQA